MEQQVIQYYMKRISELNNKLTPLLKKRRLFGWARLITAVIAFIFLWLAIAKTFILFLLPFLLLTAAFLFIVSTDISNNKQITHFELLISICEKECRILNHHFTDLPDGSQYRQPNHDYSDDLDIFGRASLFQYCNRTKTEQGSNLFSKWLLGPADSDTILDRHEAVKELANKPAWCQVLRAIGTEDQITLQSEDKILNWLTGPAMFSSSHWKVLRYILPVVMISFLILHIAGLISSSFFYTALVIAAVIAFGISKKVTSVYRQLNKVNGEIGSLAAAANHIESEKLSSRLLSSLQASFSGKDVKTSELISQLKKSLDRFDYRLNPLVFIPLNIFLFWDLQQILLLEKWRKKNGQFIRTWINDLAVFECLSTLGTLAFNHPGWCFPELHNKPGYFSAKNLGHPLIDMKNCVTNDFISSGMHQVNIITGSNMSGKSTFLRAVGVNMVLAMAGAPVFASDMEFYPSKLISSMRVTDNLEESTSTFYAELKKLKRVIDAATNGEHIFILLDEILRGTNSNDRYTGSMALIRQLLQYPVTGMLATHDLALAGLEQEYPQQIHNFHFDVQVEDDELFFDYKLKIGICQSMNASILMKKIGIRL